MEIEFTVSIIMDTDLGEIICRLGRVATVVHDYVGDTEIILAFRGWGCHRDALEACGRDGDVLAYKKYRNWGYDGVAILAAISNRQNSFAMLVLDANNKFPLNYARAAKAITMSRNEKYLSELSYSERSEYAVSIYSEMLDGINMNDIDSARWCLQIKTINKGCVHEAYHIISQVADNRARILAIAKIVLDKKAYEELVAAL